MLTQLAIDLLNASRRLDAITEADAETSGGAGSLIDLSGFYRVGGLHKRSAGNTS
jgi:hypothetical protein